MTATGPAIMDPALAVAMASMEGHLTPVVAQLQKIVRSQRATIDEQEARLHNLEILVARMMQRLGIPVSAGAMACPAAASTSTEPAAACASTSMSTVVAEGMEGAMARPDAAGSPTGPVAARASTSVSTVADEGMVAEPDGGAAGRWVAVEIPEGELIKCNLCYEASTYICANATVDDEYRASCLKMQGWTKSRNNRKWRCPPCTLKECASPKYVPDEWNKSCWHSHGKAYAEASSMSSALPAPSLEPVASPVARVVPLSDSWR